MPDGLTRWTMLTGCVLIALVCVGCGTPPASATDNISAMTAAMADTNLRDYDLQALETRIQQMPDGPTRKYFGGMLDARSGRFDAAIAALTRALPQLRESDPKRAAMALEAIGTAYRANDDYSNAARAYADLNDHLASQLDRFPEDDAALARILMGTPPQTIAWDGPVRLQTSTNPIGSRVAELVVNGVRGRWLLDTGANQSVVSRSFAERLGVTPLPGLATVGSGLTGRKSSLRVAVLPTMHVGGATLTNVVLVILDDDNLRIGSGPDAYQISAVLGYPILKALRVVIFTRDEFRAGDAAEPTVHGARMYMRGLTPVIECEVEGRPLLFTVDTGASSTDLSVRYYDLFRAQANSWKTQRVEIGGAGGSTHRDMYIQPRVIMKIGDRAVTLQDVSITPIRVNTSLDVLYGNIGQDFFGAFTSVSLDFESMRLGVE